MNMSYARLTAALVAATRKITALYPEPGIVPASEIQAIQERCRKSMAEYGHAECPWPVNWPLRRGVWVDEMAKVEQERSLTIDHDNPYGVEIYEDVRVINWELEECQI